jgi:hypothetical protein
MLSWSLSRTNQWWVKAKLMDRSDCVRNPLYATSTFPVICSCLVRLRRPLGIFVEMINIICFSVQRITRYPLLIKQILQYTEPDQDRVLTERALQMAERILDTINEAIREQEGHDRLKALSQDLWIGQGCVPPTLGLDIHAYLRFLQAAGPDSTNAAPRRPEIAERGTS